MPNMTPEARAARAKYMREWRRKNPEKQREYEAKKWENKAAKIKEEREAASASTNMRQLTAEGYTLQE